MRRKLPGFLLAVLVSGELRVPVVDSPLAAVPGGLSDFDFLLPPPVADFGRLVFATAGDSFLRYHSQPVVCS